MFDNKSYTEYLNKLFEDGYIAKDGEPLKCEFCNSKELEDFNESYNDYGLMEYGVKCKDCGKVLAYWAYGNWYKE